MKLAEYFKKRKSTVLIRALVAVVLILVIVYVLFLQTDRVVRPDQARDTVTVSIVGAGGKAVLESTEVGIRNSATVLEVTSYITQDKGIPFEFSGIGDTTEISRIGDYAENPPQGLWLLRINGEFRSVFESAGVITVTGKDIVEWLYTENKGEDVGISPELVE